MPNVMPSMSISLPVSLFSHFPPFAFAAARRDACVPGRTISAVSISSGMYFLTHARNVSLLLTAARLGGFGRDTHPATWPPNLAA